jgi:hypothetical protein
VLCNYYKHILPGMAQAERERALSLATKSDADDDSTVAFLRGDMYEPAGDDKHHKKSSLTHQP